MDAQGHFNYVPDVNRRINALYLYGSVIDINYRSYTYIITIHVRVRIVRLKASSIPALYAIMPALNIDNPNIV